MKRLEITEAKNIWNVSEESQTQSATSEGEIKMKAFQEIKRRMERICYLSVPTTTCSALSFILLDWSESYKKVHSYVDDIFHFLRILLSHLKNFISSYTIIIIEIKWNNVENKLRSWINNNFKLIPFLSFF